MGNGRSRKCQKNTFFHVFTSEKVRIWGRGLIKKTRFPLQTLARIFRVGEKVRKKRTFSKKTRFLTVKRGFSGHDLIHKSDGKRGSFLLEIRKCVVWAKKHVFLRGFLWNFIRISGIRKRVEKSVEKTCFRRFRSSETLFRGGFGGGFWGGFPH